MTDIFRYLFSNNDKLSSRTIAVKQQIFLSFIIKIVSVVTSILLVPLLIDFLDEERYGIWLTLTSIFTWFSFFDIGLGNGMRNKLTEALAHKNKVLAKEYVSTTFFITSLIFILLLIIFQIINPLLNWQSILNTKFIDADELYLLTSIIFSLFLIRFIFQLIGVIYIADQKPAVNNALITFGSVLSFLIIFVIYKITVSGSLVLLGLVLVGTPLVVLIVFAIYSFTHKYRFLRPSYKSFKLHHVRSLFTLGIKFFIIQVASILMFSTANIIIVQLFNPAEVVVYQTTFLYYQVPIMIYSIIITPIWSAVTDAFVKEDFEWMHSTLKKLKTISLLFSLGVIVMFILRPFVFSIWLGERVQIPNLLSISMAVYTGINILLIPYTNFINGIGKLKLSTVLVSFTLILYLPLAILLSKILASSAGIILATAILNAIGLLFESMQLKRILNKRANGIWND